MAEPPRSAKTALMLAGAGGLCFLGAAAVYQEPQSFYTNFVLFPSLLLMLVGTVLDLIAGAMALFNLRGSGRKEALFALGIVVLVPVISIATIQLILRR
jgi:hypothetical protein